MQTVTAIDAIRSLLQPLRRQGKKIGLVPTMGYFHEGHLSLMRAARAACDVVVVSLFVNPMQFGPREDLERYPRDLAGDQAMARAAGADFLFAPTAEAIYPPGYKTYVEVEGLTGVLCGASRPGHFRGVTTVVTKLLNIVQPDQAFFGQKDAQQALIIQRMVRDLNLPVMVEVAPTVREADGLAMSSRNVYLKPEERAAATVLYRALQRARAMIETGERDAGVVLEAVRAELAGEPLARVEYAEIRECQNLTELLQIEGQILLALAVRVGETRLIDNLMLEV